jgi:hypothetical protein
MQRNVQYRRHEWNENTNKTELLGRERGENVFYIEKRAFLCGELFLFGFQKKGIAMH